MNRVLIIGPVRLLLSMSSERFMLPILLKSQGSMKRKEGGEGEEQRA